MTTLENRLAQIELLAKRGEASDVQSLLELLADDEWQTRRAASKAISTVVPAMQNIDARDELIREVLFAVSNTADAPKRAAAIAALEAIGRLALPHMARALAVAPPPTRTALAGVVGVAGGPGAVNLLEPLCNETDTNVVAASLVALGHTRCPDALPILLKRIEDGEEWLRFAAIGAAGELGDRRAVPHLEKLLLDVTNRDAAIAALVEIGTVESAQALADHVMQTDGKNVDLDLLSGLVAITHHARSLPVAVARAIENIARHAVPESAREVLLVALADQFPNGDAGKANACLTVLGWLNEFLCLPVVCQLLTNSAYASVARGVLITLAATPDGVEEILARTGKELPVIETANVFAEIRSMAALKGCLQLLKLAEDEDAHHACLLALEHNTNWLATTDKSERVDPGSYISDTIFDYVSKNADNPPAELGRVLGLFAAAWSNDEIRQVERNLFSGSTEASMLAQLAFLAESDASLSLAAAFRALKHPAPRVRVAALEVLARSAHILGPVSLAAQMTDESAAVRRAAARAQQWFVAGPGSMRALVASLNDDDIWVRVEAIGCLSVISGSDEGIGLRLVAGLSSSHPLCRVASIEAQEFVKHPDWAGLSDLAQRDRHPEVRSAALRSLARHPEISVITGHILQGLSDADWSVRYTAVDLSLQAGYTEMSDWVANLAGDNSEVPAVRAHAISALAEWNAHAAVRVLTAALDDPAHSVVQAAFDGLMTLRGARRGEYESSCANCSPRVINLVNFILQAKQEVPQVEEDRFDEQVMDTQSSF